MKFYLFFCIILKFYISTSTKFKPQLERKILNFGYGINYKYEGMSAHSSGRFYVVIKFILPAMGDLKFSKLDFDNSCAYTENKFANNTES